MIYTVILFVFLAPFFFMIRIRGKWLVLQEKTLTITKERDDSKESTERVMQERDAVLRELEKAREATKQAIQDRDAAILKCAKTIEENIQSGSKLQKIVADLNNKHEASCQDLVECQQILEREKSLARSREDHLLKCIRNTESKLEELSKRYAPFENQYVAIAKANKLMGEINKKIKHNKEHLVDLMRRREKAEEYVFLVESGTIDSLLPLADSKSAAEELTRIKINISDMIKSGKAFSYHHDGYYKTLNHKSIKPLTTIAMRALKEAHELIAWKIKADKLDKSIDDLYRVAETISDNLVKLCGARFSSEFITLKALELNVIHTLKVRQEQERDVLAEAARDEREMRKAEKAARAAERKEREAQTLFEEEVRRTQAEEARQREMMEQLRLAAENAAAEQREEYAQRLRDMEERAAQGSAEAAEAIRKLKADLKAAQDATIRATAMASLTRTGYVYVISNEGSFGEEVVKIGLTRRIDPQERIKELSGASVPFPFDVHMMLFSEDAPALESALHSRFSEARVNTENPRKEFFRVGLDQVEAVVSEIAPDAVFTKDVHSADWLRTVQKRTAHLNRIAAGA